MCASVTIGRFVAARFRPVHHAGRFDASHLRLDNPHRAVNECLLFMRRRGETAPGKCGWRAPLAVQTGLGRKQRDTEGPKLRPIAELCVERDGL